MTWLHNRLAPGYDLFKLIVAILLIILLITLLLQSRQAASKSQIADLSTPTSTATQTSLPEPIRTQVSTPTLPSLPDTPTPTFPPWPDTPTPTPFISVTETVTETPTPLPPTSEPTQLADAGCPSAMSRIKIGDKVRVLLRLNFREGPGLNWPIIQTNNSGTDLKVIGGPVCTSLMTDTGLKAYLWWNVRMSNDMEGWSAEAPLINPFYFLDPIR